MNTTDVVDSLVPEAQQLLETTGEERIMFIKSERFIPYPRAKEIIKKLEELIREPRQTRMPCLLLIGESGSGKTSIIKKMERMYPPTDGIRAAAMPLVSIQAPFQPDVPGLYDRIFEAILVPFKKNDTNTKKELEIKYHFYNLQTKMLIIDEIHNILSGSVAKQRAFMNALKNLSNELRMSIVVAGTKAALNATDTDTQISSRFPPMGLKRWRLDKVYLSLLASIERTLPLRKDSNIAQDQKIATTVLELSEGLIGEVFAVIKQAAIYAIESKDERITPDTIKAIRFIPLSQRRELESLDV